VANPDPVVGEEDVLSGVDPGHVTVDTVSLRRDRSGRWAGKPVIGLCGPNPPALRPSEPARLSAFRAFIEIEALSQRMWGSRPRLPSASRGRRAHEKNLDAGRAID